MRKLLAGRDGRTVAIPFTAAAALLALSATLSIAVAQNGSSNGADLPAGPGRDLFVQTCSQCHALGTATGKKRSSEDWSSVIKAMIAQGAQIDGNQEKLIHDYLAANFAEAAGASAASDAMAAAPAAAPGHYPRPSGPNQWPAYGAGNANTNFSPLAQITPRNVKNLKRAWVFHYGAGQTVSGDQGLDYRFEATPLIIGGVMYVSTPASPAKPNLKSTVTALRPETGEVLWRYESPVNIHGRGIAYWPGDANTAPRLIFGTDGGLIMAVDVTTGQLAPGFGRRGQIDAYIGVVSEKVGDSRRSTFTIPNPVTIYKNLIITGSRPGEVGPPGPRGDIRAFDARTGRLVWDFHTVPQPGEPNHDKYAGDEWRDVTGANVWSTMTLDDATGTLYAPTGDLNSYAKGMQPYANSLLAIDANTGKLKWYHQIVHRDIWDWDLPTPPILLDVKKNGQTIPAVALTGKMSLFFLFDRRTGAPLNGFEEKPTPQPRVPSPDVSPTQPFPDAPGPLARTQMTRDEIPALVPGMRQYCQKYWDDNGIVGEPLYGFRQSADSAVVTYPSSVGGPNWGGGSYNPDLHLFFINVQNRAQYQPKAPAGTGPVMMMHNSPDDPASGPPRPPRPRGRRVPAFTYQTPDGLSLSCGATPWGELVAVDVETLKIAWRSPLGTTEGLGAKGETTGTANIGGSIATRSGLIFIGATNDRRFRAFDAKTGKKLWEAPLDADAHSAPITYMGSDGKQYVVVAAGGGTIIGGPQMSDALVAYRLP
jgi:quinoprotein glucose dehydrogenase